MELYKLERLLKAEPKYRLDQAYSVIFKDLIVDWGRALILPLEIRKKLNDQFPLEIKSEMEISKEGDAVKARIEMKDGVKVESVLMRHEDGRNTICVSCQAGCALGCEFCATGRMGFKRNLYDFEIVEQALFFARYLRSERSKITNVVFMGMGEPFLNYDNVLKAIRILNDKRFFNIGARSISISTVGITEGIDKLAEEKLQVNLAVSLHAPDDETRKNIMPIAEKYSLNQIFKSVDDYIEKTKRKVMFEYIMIKGVNDSDRCAEKLSLLMKKPLYFLNIISYNPAVPGFSVSDRERIKQFKTILNANGIKFSERHRFGQDVKAACGQFKIN